MEKRTAFVGDSEDLYCNRFRLRLQHRPVDSKLIAIKEPASRQSVSPLIAELKHEHAITSSLSGIQGVRQALGMEGPRLLLEYIPGQSLRQQIEAGDLDLGRKLQIAVALADVLKDIHARQVIHQGISSANILVANGARL